MAYNLSDNINKLLDNLLSDQKIIDQATTLKKSAPHVTRRDRILKDLADLRTSPEGEYAYLTACCITGKNLNTLFDDCRPEENPSAFFRPENLLPILSKYNVLNKITAISAFAKDLPDLTAASHINPSEPERFTNIVLALTGYFNPDKKPFSEELVQKLKEEYTHCATDTEIDRRQQTRILTVIELLAERQYPAVQLLAAELHFKNNNPARAKEFLTMAVRNPLSTIEERNKVRAQINHTEFTAMLLKSKQSANQY